MCGTTHIVAVRRQMVNAVKGAMVCHVLQLTLTDSFYHDSVNTVLSQILDDVGHTEKSVRVDLCTESLHPIVSSL